MKHFFTRFLTMAVLVMSTLSLNAQQLPDPGFEDWSGAKFDGNIQPKSWHASNVSQVGQSYNFITRETGRSGYAAKVANTFCGLGSIGQTSPGYLTLGSPWQYLPSITQLSSATGGTDGGISFTYRPDSMYVWIKRTGSKVGSEHYSVLFYSWSGTSKGTSYKANTANSCTSTSHTDEESDIRQAMDANTCGTPTKANQVAEGFFFEMKEHSSWTQIKVPIYYFNDDAPTKCNVIFSSSGYPNFRKSDNINDGNAIYVDDVELIYSSKIQQLYIGGKVWNGFDPNSSEEQTYSVGHTTEVPEIYAVRGAGTLTNIAGTKVSCPGRKLSGSEITINYGKVDGAPTVITVKSGDGKSTTTYKIKMVQAASENATLASILVNGEAISGFNPQLGQYDVSLPYGTTAAPVVSVVQAEDKQTVAITQATSPTGKATIVVTAADGKTKKTYTLNFSIAQLADNTLAGIKVNGEEIADFTPSLTSYRVELPLGTTTMPKVEAVSKYPAGAQTITYEAPDKIDGGTYKISVTTPGNAIAKVYRLTFAITASTNSKLKDLQMEGQDLGFSPNKTTYYVTLPMGTTVLPKITYVKGDAYQTVEVTEGGVDGTTTILVTAASGAQTTYRIICSTEKSEASHLNMIYVGGVALEDFNPNTTTYTYQLTPGTTELPEITWEKGDEYETVTINYGGLNGTTRITVVAGNGNTTIYKITFSLELAADVTLDAIYVDGKLVEGFSKDVYTYQIVLPKGTDELPAVTWDKHDETQTVTPRYGGVNGDTKITVRAQSGATAVYTLQFRVYKESVNHLNMIYLDGELLSGFDKDTLNYIDSLPVGVSKIPAITWDLGAASATARLVNQGNQRMIRVTAEDGSVREYVILFIISKSESAFPKMIYVDGQPLPGFDPKELEYTYMFEGDKAPEITVEKDGNQQVTILTPVRDGVATIIVSPEGGGEGNTYIINLMLKPKAAVQLNAILLDGKLLEGFRPDELDYAVDYSGAMPVASYLAEDDQTVNILTEGETVRFVVSADGEQAIYTVRFNRILSADTRLAAILLNGGALANFDPAVYAYPITLPAGSQVPEIGYTLGNEAQVVTLGQTGDKTFAITVYAENGDSTAVYTLDFTIEPFTSTELQALSIDGEPVALEEGVYTYNRNIDAGAELPALDVTPAGGQTILTVNTSDTQQQIIVKSEDGNTATYTINYTPVYSSEAKLDSIILDGTPLEGFDPNTYNYTHTLAWRSTVVPVIRPVGATPHQTIEIHYGAVNSQTHIHVIAADKVSTADYYIDFPVQKSSNVALQSVVFEDADFDFDPETTDYIVNLPYQTKAVPTIFYTAAEPEQSIKYISAPISGTTQLIVTAENGDQRTYNFNFNVPASDKPNVLAALYITTNKQADTKREVAEDETDITINLPYGTTEFNIGYDKSYDEQAVIVQPGGIFAPTVITVKANRGDEEDKVYTITPNIETQNPAVLSSITVNGSALTGFDKNRFSYVINVAAQPTVVAKDGDGEIVIPTEHSSKHWQASVTKDGYTNTYDIWYYYNADVIPNHDFTEWTSNSKPTGWHVLADFASSYTYTFFTFTPGEEVSKNGTSVAYLHTQYNAAPLAGYIPGYVTLGNITYNYGRWGSSAFGVTGGITFRNTPDVLSVNYRNAKVNNNSRILYTLTGSGGTKTITHTDSKTSSSFATTNISLSDANETVGIPTMMNIVLNSFDSESGKNGTVGGEAEMYVDWVKFVYNSTLSKVKVNGADATLSNKTFSYTLPSSETIGVPQLSFVGQVSDQAQKVVWDTTDPKALTRTATVTNYAEDGTFTSYQVVVKRPASTIATLSDLKVNGVTVTGWNADVTDYEIPVGFGQKRLCDVQAIHGSNLQTIAVSQTDETVTIIVTPESGEAKTYTVTFVEQKSNDVTLAGIAAAGVEYDPAIKTYALTQAEMPNIKFVKKSDGQTVTLDNGVLYIVAEDGVTKDTITITNTPPAVPTSGKLFDLALDDYTIEDFDASTYSYTKPQPLATSFVREFASDAVVQTITPDSVTWQIQGTEQHTYTLVYPTEISAEAVLAMIKVNGEPLADFSPAETEYTYASNDPIRIEVVAQPGQTITTSVSVEAISNAPGRNAAPANAMGLRYTLDVKAENGINTLTYVINVVPKLSDDATLKMIRLNGADLDGFAADQMRYVVTLPAENPKVAEPKLPAVMYVANQYAQNIALETYTDNDTTYHYITVTSEDGVNENVYELLLTAEPSHNAQITALMLDGKMLDNFSPARTFYSASVTDLDVEVSYSAADRFLTIEKILNGNTLTLHVVAQDQVTTNDYVVELYTQPLSADVSLADILLNGQSFTDYNAALTPFTPMNSYYTIPLTSTQPRPDVSAQLGHVGQSMEIDASRQDTVLITVRAEDGVHSNTYVLFFKVDYSSSTALSKLEVGDSPLTLVPGQFNYTYALPVGEKQPRAVTFELENYTQQTAENENTEGLRWSVDVVAEDGTRATYTVTFVPTLSQNAALSDITANEVSLEGFSPDVFSYVITLPQGERRLPSIKFYEGDDWQQPQQIDTIATTLRTTYKCTVLAEDSIHRAVYSVEINILPSDVDTLAAINVKGLLLDGFDPYRATYSYVLPKGTTELPLVEFEPGDPYQTIDSVSTGLNGTMSIIVTAENGNQRRYAINFSVERENNTTLQTVNIGGTPLEDFDPETPDYTITLPHGTTAVPVVTFTKADPKQEVVISVADNVVTITVTAENGEQRTYTLTFIEAKSSEAHLSSITVGDELLAGFDPNTFEYTITLPYGTTELPQVSATLADSTATMEIAVSGQAVTISTLSADNSKPYDYVVIFVIEGCPVNYLTDLQVSGVTIDGFHQDSTFYTLAYPVGSDSTAFVHADAVTYVAGDTTETITVSEEHSTIYVTVKAQNGDVRVYAINQVISLSDNSLLSDITLNGVSLANFNDSTYEYEYLLLEGETLPMVEAVAQDSLAEVSVTPGAVGEATLIYCTAQDGTETIYKVLFRVSSINTAVEARSTDVLFKQIGGTDQFAAYSIRNNTSIAIFDQYGHLMFDQVLPVCNPNDVTIAADPNGREIVTDAHGDGAFFTIPVHGQVFFYMFYSNNQRICSGKFMVQ